MHWLYDDCSMGITVLVDQYPRLSGYIGLPSVTELGNDITDDMCLGLVVPFPPPTFLDNPCAR
jgi:hypothetical protein